MFSFHSKLIKTDVTAVKLYCNHIFAGVGNYLQVFNQTSNEVIAKIHVFNGQEIHGINISNNKLLLYGGIYLRVLIFNLEKRIFEYFTPITNVGDWILAGKFLKDDKIVTVLMHNILLILTADLHTEDRIICEEKCNLYSAFICNDNLNELIVLSGTVFSEILVWSPLKNPGTLLTRLRGHNGVIFWIDCCHSYIASCSDDRSTILWTVKSGKLHPDYPVDIELTTKVYGHQSRVFRCKITDHLLTAGEDSLVNVWKFNGERVRKIETHQGAPVWALDSINTIVVTGGGNGGLTVFSLNHDLVEEDLALKPNSLKCVAMLKSENLVVTTDKAVLFYFDFEGQKWSLIDDWQEDLGAYHILARSECRNLVSLAGYNGQVYLYKETGKSLSLTHKYKHPSQSRIFSFHWLSCNLFLICLSEGKLSLNYIGRKIRAISELILPTSKERWTTSACLAGNYKLIVGDRKGNIYVYVLGEPNPVKTVRKAHNYLGITYLSCLSTKLVSLGRDAVVKMFDKEEHSLVSSDKLPFSWLAKFCSNFLLGFSGNHFLIWDYEKRRNLLEINCGGGHRSWDFSLTTTFNFVYIKDKMIKTVKGELAKLTPIDLISGFHVWEINAIKVLKLNEEFLLLSGGEDTTLRLSLINSSKFRILSVLKSHLSSIRTIFCYESSPGEVLVFSGGGRAQIVSWKLTLHECRERFSYYESVDKNEGEVRIMDLNVQKIRDSIVLFAACSDGNVKIFLVDPKGCLVFQKKLFYKLKCIFKICFFRIFTFHVLATMASDGFLVFWEVSDLSQIELVAKYKCHQSGINSCHFKFHSNLLLFLTGGDDNAIILDLLRISEVGNSLKIEKISQFKDVGSHCAQITGTFICDNFFLTASIDHRIIVFKWVLQNDCLICEKLNVYHSVIADIQGIDCFFSNEQTFDVFVYGNGVEFLQISKN